MCVNMGCWNRSHKQTALECWREICYFKPLFPLSPSHSAQQTRGGGFVAVHPQVGSRKEEKKYVWVYTDLYMCMYLCVSRVTVNIVTSEWLLSVSREAEWKCQSVQVKRNEAFYIQAAIKCWDSGLELPMPCGGTWGRITGMLSRAPTLLAYL